MAITDELRRYAAYFMSNVQMHRVLAIADRIDKEHEKAIAATLGAGTCKQEEHGWSTEGDHARVWLTCGHDYMVETVADLPHFCPICGAKVVD